MYIIIRNLRIRIKLVVICDSIRLRAMGRALLVAMFTHGPQANEVFRLLWQGVGL